MQHLEAILEKTDLPLDYLVVISFPSSIFITNPHDSPLIKKICHGYSLIERIQALEKRYAQECLDLKTFKKICRVLLNKHVPPVYDLQKLYEIENHEIMTGVQCPICLSLPMSYKRGRWLCPQCHHLSTDAHIETLKQYEMLFGQQISNSEMRRFLNLPTCQVTSKFIRSMNLSPSGTTKGRQYQLQTKE